jgi:PPOX class probable F420-dependent enzyme
MLRERVAGAEVAHLATVRPDGTPHVVPCCLVVDLDKIYSAVDAKSKSTLELQRLENLRWQPAAAVLVDHYDEDWAELWWVRADGRGRVIEHGEEHERAKSLLEDKYPQYRKIAIPGAVIAVDVERWRGWP